MLKLKKHQITIAQSSLTSKTFLEGTAGTGKSTAGVERLRYLLDSGIPANEVLVLLPQQTLSFPYTEFLKDPNLSAGGQVTVTTMGGLARRVVDVFWVLVTEDAGFTNPSKRPTFFELRNCTILHGASD